MGSTLVAAWAVAFIAFIGSLFVFRRSGLSGGESVLFSFPFFTAPLFIAIGGAGSYVYPVDIGVPLLVFMAWRRLGEVPGVLKAIALSLFLGVGLVPLIMVVLHMSGDRMTLLYVLINAYRVAGCSAMLICAATCRISWERQRHFIMGMPLLSYGILAVVLAVAMLLQGLHFFDTNVFYRWEGATARYDEASAGFSVVGLFRGSMGIIGVMGIVAYLAYRRVTGVVRVLALVGAIAGMAVVVGTVSKTSLAIAIGIIFVAALLSAVHGQIRKVAIIIIGVALGLPAASALHDYLPVPVQKTISGFLSGDERHMITFQGRQSRWREAVDYVRARPEVVIGGGLDERYSASNMNYYHNEYLGIFMYGGIWSFFPYALGLIMLAVCLMGRWRGQSPFVVFAGLLFLCGLVEGVTVDHLLPGVFFTSTAALFCLGYGLAFHPLASGSSSVPLGALAETPIRPFAWETP